MKKNLLITFLRLPPKSGTDQIQIKKKKKACLMSPFSFSFFLQFTQENKSLKKKKIDRLSLLLPLSPS